MKHEQQLHALALRAREHIIRMATNGGCFIGASLSCADIFTYLYASGVAKISPEAWKNNSPRDFILLSKGHAVPAMYGVLAELGYFDAARLQNHLKANDTIYWHPNRNIPGVEFQSGSLGHILSVAMGIAYDIKMKNEPNTVYVLMGDGELNEGSVWESVLVAAAHRLDNLVVIIDRNSFQANILTEELIPLESIERKFESFGWSTETIDGHNFKDMDETFRRLPFNENHPSMIVAQTIRGKGVPSIEHRVDRWFANISETEAMEMIRELHGGSITQNVEYQKVEVE